MTAWTRADQHAGPEVDPGTVRAQLFPLMFGFYPTQVLHTIASLGVADLLGDGPATAEQLAGPTGTHAPSLYRLLRAAATFELVTRDDEGRFALTGRGQLLRGGVPGSVRNLVLLFAGDEVWRSWGQLEYSVRTGDTAHRHLFGQGPFERLAQHPEQEAIFNEAMAEHTREVGPAIAACCDLAGRSRIADLGGGNGTLLAVLLHANPELRGVLFDTASGLREADGVLTEAGVRDRCEIVTGDFFDAVPAGCDAYLLKSVIHDWDDEQSVRILRRCREAMAPGAVVFVVEPVVPADPATLVADGRMLMSDLNMLACVGGRERTQAEFAAVLSRAGLVLDGVVRCAPPASYSVLRAVPSVVAD